MESYGLERELLERVRENARRAERSARLGRRTPGASRVIVARGLRGLADRLAPNEAAGVARPAG